MAEDGELSGKQLKKAQDTFHRAQEVPSEHRFPARPGIVSIPLGCRGPRSLYIQRRDDSFGFKLRHLIVYPPSENGDRHARKGEHLQHMETIFVRNIVEGGPAEQAGLRVGDCLVAVNGIPVCDKSYSEVVNYIQHSPDFLHLLVISREEDVIQTYYKEFAYNPASNQQQEPYRKQSLHPQHPGFYHQPSTFPRKGSEYHADSISWRSLQNSNLNSLEQSRLNPRQQHQQRSADNILNPSPKHFVPSKRSLEGHKQHSTHEVQQRPRAQPQVPQRKMGRRASEGSSFAERDIYHQVVNNSEMVVGDNGAKMKTATKGGCYPDPSHHPSLEMAGCRLSLDAGRRDSSSSLTSSLADGSKDSLSSYDSSSTITGGYDLDETMMTRILKSLKQKEKFLQPNPPGPKEFYGRPQKLDKPVWPPEGPRNDSPSRTVKPTHQNFQRVKNDIDSERDYVQCKENYKMPEASIAPSMPIENHQQVNGTSMDNVEADDKRNCSSNLQIVQTRAKQFESGRSLPEDDPLNDRTSFYKSELARVSEKRVVPSVTVRAREYETKSGIEQRNNKENSTAILRKSHRDSRSLDSSGSNSSINSITENIFGKYCGNMTVPIGSKYIHVPPPKDYQESEDVRNLDNQPNKLRHRSNSADSWVMSPSEGRKEDNESLGNDLDVTTKKDRTLQEAMDISLPVTIRNSGLRPNSAPSDTLSDQIVPPQTTPKLSVTPPSGTTTQQGGNKVPVRPTQLDLSNAPKRPNRHLRPLDSLHSSPSRPLSPAEEDRAMRRESYLKATEGGRMPFDVDFNVDFNDGDVSPQVLRSAHRKWKPPLFPGDIQQLRKLFEDTVGGSVSGGSSNSSVSLDREKRPSSPVEREKQNVIREGSLHCKITEIDGKRSGDRSWKQVWVVLRGPKLYLYKDKHHQSPVGSSDIAEQSLASGIDMRASCVGIPEDYTKRKHVLRVSSVVPCRSEILLQAENPVDLAEWVKCLQDQVAANDEEFKTEQAEAYKQQAVPQTIPASTSIQVQGSTRLSPQSNKSKLTNLRNRSPTGHSPVSKNRKPVQVTEVATSPKSKTWRGRVAKQFRKIQGASSPTSPTAPEGSTFGVLLEHCQQSGYNQFVPRLVEACTEIVETKGLETIGIYRVPGNNAAVTALTEEANRCDELTQIDPRWNDVHVVSSLLKSFFRKMPDSLLTANLYSKFIDADKIENTIARLEQIKKLIKMLPPHHYHTLKHLILHLKRVVENSNMNKMEAKNLAIVFGPTIVRAAEESMETMVNDMTHQCKIVESLLVYADWFFNDISVEELNLSAPIAMAESQENDQINTNLLLDNISKVEGLKEQKEKKEFITSLISAAHRKVKRKPAKSHSSSQDSKEEGSTPNGIKEFTAQSFDVTDFKENTIDCKQSIPTTVTDLEQSTKPWFNYKTDREQVEQRIKNFIQETEANLSASRKQQNSALERRATGPISTSASNVSQPLTLTNNPHERVITKTHSASNVFSRTTNNSDNSRNSLNSTDNYRVQYPVNYKYSDYGGYNRNSDQMYDRRRPQIDNNPSYQVYKSSFSDVSTTSSSSEVRNYNSSPTGYGIRKGNSAENINIVDLKSNGNLKKIKYENEVERSGSLDSLNKIDDDGDLLKTMTKIYDEKKKELTAPLLSEIDLPFVDESSPEKSAKPSLINKENIPASPKLYRDPSLHKSQYSSGKPPSSLRNKELKETIDKDKDEDSTMIQDENIPDNERNISNQDKLNMECNKKVINFTLAPASVKLKRSESLNKPDRTVSPLTIKLKRSESLNKASDRLKRSDSLTKNEKTESNISKRREFASSNTRRSNKEFTKLKRKNGMPERSIKRRHTVGGTKDPDKVTWLDNRNHKEDTNTNDSKNENKSSLRTSSPDLSTSRKERLFLQFNFEIAQEDMVAAFKQHFIRARPQSFPETSVYKVPLESHV
ncbi:rho GTPase-activating protein 23 isoform X4 [Onthophagus taurus]|uniref:rho GTPase-activating protein 23 isoform X4 n=1 Tax=Onthophagus taurus TaxID=166361 RepID=UPI0039BEC92A